jgi:Flp pilus assembly protein TadB
MPYNIGQIVIWVGCLLGGLSAAWLLALAIDERWGGTPEQSPTGELPLWQRPPELTPPWISITLAVVCLIPGVALLLRGAPLVFAVPLLALCPLAPVFFVRRRLGQWANKLDDQVFQLIQLIELRIKAGDNLYSALERLCGSSSADATRQSLQPLSGELSQHLLGRIAAESNHTPVAQIFRSLADSPRYAPCPDLRLVFLHLASATGEARLGPEAVADRLHEVAEVLKMKRTLNQKLEARIAQTTNSRLLVTFIIVATGLYILNRAPDFGAHLLYHPIGQITLFVAVMLVIGANVLSSLLARVRTLQF